MIIYLLILSESEGVSIAAKHLPRPGDVIDVVKDYGDRPRFKFTVSHVEFEAVVEDVSNSSGIRGRTETLPMVHGKITSRRVQSGVWETVK